MPSLPQEVLIEKASQWQSRFLGNTASFNDRVTNEGVCLGLSVWRLYSTLTGKYKEYENLLKLIYEVDPLEDNISPEAHQAFETFIQNTIWLQHSLGIEAGTIQGRMKGALEALFERKGEVFPLTYHHQFAGVISEAELKDQLLTYLTIKPDLQQGVGFTLGCHQHAISITRVGNRIEVVDPSEGKVWAVDIPQKESAAATAAELRTVVNKMFEETINGALHFDESEFQGTYHGVSMHVYSRLHNPKPEVLPAIYPTVTDQLTVIYGKRKDSLDQQDKHSKVNALDSAIQNGDQQLVLYLEHTLGAVKLEACKNQAFKRSVLYGQFEFVNRYYKNEFVDQNIIRNAYATGNEELINFFLEKGHRFDKKGFEYALAEAVQQDQGYTFALLLKYYAKFHDEQPTLVNPSELITAFKSDKVPTPLFNLAAKNTSVEVMRMLLAKNVNVSLTDALGRNSLHYLSVHQPDLFVEIAARNPVLLFAKDKAGESPIYRVYKEGGKELKDKICALLIKKEEWYEAYLLALISNNQSMIKQCRENISFTAMLKREGDSRTSKNRFVDLCEEDRFDDARTVPFIQVLVGIKYTEQTQDTLHDIYLLALKHSKNDIITSVLEVPSFDQNALFKKGSIVALFPWFQLAEKPELFDLIAKKVDINKLTQASLIEYYLLALRHKKIDLCKTISSHIVDKNVLLLKSAQSETDPFDIFEKDAALFNHLISSISLDALKPEALNKMYQLGLEHNNQAVYSKCIKRLQVEPRFLTRTDDLDWCYAKKSNAQFKELFSIKNVSEEWCKKVFIESIYADNYEIAATILTKFPQFVNAQLDKINESAQLPLWVAIHKQNVDRCQFLLAHGANPYEKRLSITLMEEGKRREPLKELFSTYDANIRIIQNQFLDVLDKLKEHKEWNLKKKYGFFGGDYVDALSLNEGNKVLHFPKELQGIFEIILKARQENKLPVLKEHIHKLSVGINSMADKVVPTTLKQKLMEALNPSKPKFIAMEAVQFAPNPFQLFSESIKSIKSADHQDDAGIHALRKSS